VGAVEDVAGALDGGVVAECLADVLDVVVDGLRDADDGQAEPAPQGLLGDFVGAVLGAVAADADEDLDVAGLEPVDDFADVLLSARGGEEGAAFAVDVLDELRGEDERGTPLKVRPAKP